jgi:hypothetical protein
VNGMPSGTLSIFLVYFEEHFCTDTLNSHHRGFQDARNHETGFSSFWWIASIPAMLVGMHIG